MNPKRILVIGLGSIGMRHARNLLDLGHIVYGYDIDEARMLKAETLGIATSSQPFHLYQYLDGAVIASPTIHHFSHITKFDAVPLFVEKPIAYTRPELDSLRTRNDNIAMVGNNLRFHSNVNQAKYLITRYASGPMDGTFFVLQKTDKPIYLRDGVIHNWGAHEIDLALYLFSHCGGQPYVDRCTGDDIQSVISLRWDDGSIATIVMNYSTEPERRSFSICDKRNGDTIVTANLVDGLVNDKPVTNSFDVNYIDEMRAFIDRIDGKDTPGATKQDGLNTLQIILDALDKRNKTCAPSLSA